MSSYGGGSSSSRAGGAGYGNSNESGGDSSSGGDSNEKYNYVFKFIIIGDTGTGKSCALHQFVEGKCK